MPSGIKIHSILFFVGAIYAGNYIIAKEVMPQYVAPSGLILIRVWIAALIFLLIQKFSVNEKIKSKKDLFLIFRASMFGVVINQLFFFEGLSRTSPINASLIMTATPILVLIISSIVLKEKITSRKAIGVFLGFTGAIMLIGHRGFSLSGGTFKGDILVFINASSYAVYLVLVKPLMRKYHPITVVSYAFICAMPFVGVFGFQAVKDANWGEFSINIYLAISYIVIGVTILAYLLNAWALQFVNASLVGIYIYLQPLLASFLAVILGKDDLTLNKLLFALLIFSGVYLVSIKK